MDNTSLEVLVIIISVALGIFLLLATYLVVKLIQVTNHIKKITRHAEQVADRADHISEFFAKTATPVAIAKLISNLTETWHKKKNKKSSNKEDK